MERGGGRGGTAREGFGFRTESIWIVGLPPATASLLSSGAKEFPLFLIGSGGGGRLIGLVDGLGREEIERRPKRGDGLEEAGLKWRVGGGGGGRLGDLRSDEEADLR